MTINRLMSGAVALVVLLSWASGAAWADRDKRGGRDGDGARSAPRGYVLDKRYQHTLFIQRLMPATFHKILPEWQAYLLNAGFKQQLITRLPMAGNGDFAHAPR